jgi:hypothetical protein
MRNTLDNFNIFMQPAVGLEEQHPRHCRHLESGKVENPYSYSLKLAGAGVSPGCKNQIFIGS